LTLLVVCLLQNQHKALCQSLNPTLSTLSNESPSFYSTAISVNAQKSRHQKQWKSSISRTLPAGCGIRMRGGGGRPVGREVPASRVLLSCWEWLRTRARMLTYSLNFWPSQGMPGQHSPATLVLTALGRDSVLKLRTPSDVLIAGVFLPSLLTPPPEGLKLLSW
jgi:hypothetical protein